MENIPSTSEFSMDESFIENMRKIDEKNAEKQRKYAEKMEMKRVISKAFSDKYKEYVIDKINEAFNKKTVIIPNGWKYGFLNVNIDPTYLLETEYGKKPVHTVHYGKFIDDELDGFKWEFRYRNSFGIPFQTIQEELIKKGWYLLDEARNCRGIKMHIYQGKPAHYDGEKEYWHGFNKLPKDSIILRK